MGSECVKVDADVYLCTQALDYVGGEFLDSHRREAT